MELLYRAASGNKPVVAGAMAPLHIAGYFGDVKRAGGEEQTLQKKQSRKRRTEMITTVTLNVAVDKAYVIGEFHQGEVMRVQKCTNTAGGKGLNVAKVAKQCGEEVLATGFAGGHAGAYIEQMLEEQKVAHDFVHTASETRSCINVLAADGSSTEFLEPGAPVSEEEKDRFIAKFDQIIDKSDVITISGSAPKGLPDDIYRQMIEAVKAKGKQVILDTSGRLLEQGIKAAPTMIKPNSDEIAALLGVGITNRGELIVNGKKLQGMGIEYVVISLGADGALVITADHVYHGQPPKITPVNTVGCGDSMVAAFAVGLARAYSVEECLKYAVSVSAANALTMATGHFEPEDQKRLYEQAEVTCLE